MTIDFHPTVQELQDKEKFRVKQYSVTLPPMNETNYKSHRELLDELVVSIFSTEFYCHFEDCPYYLVRFRLGSKDNSRLSNSTACYH